MSKNTKTLDTGTASQIQIGSDQSNSLTVISNLSNPSFDGGAFGPPGLVASGISPIAFAPAQGGFSSLGSQTILFAPDSANGAHGHGGGPPGSGSGSGTLPPAPTTQSSPFVINITWDSSVANAPSGFVTAFDNAVYYLENHFTNNVTININVGYGEVAGTNLSPGALGESESYLSSYTFSQLYNAWKADPSSQGLTLLSANPAPGATYWTTTAEAKALGLMSASSSPDGYIGFSSGNVFTYSGTVASGTYDFYGVAVHELTEVMGRLLLAGSTVGGGGGASYPDSYALYDLFRYSSQGVQDISTSMGGYFSANGGSTSNNPPTGAFNTVSGGDYGDWASSMTNDAFDAFANSGVTLGISSVDLTVLQALGWNPGTSTGSTPIAPTGINIAPVTSALSGVSIATGLAAGASLATFSAIGGASGDTYTYSLGGTDAGSFTLGSSGNTLTTASELAGSTPGKVYALTVTANDSNGTSSPAVPLDVVVGTGGSDTINLATAVGSGATSTPTFIYAGGGSDIIDGSGMSGNLLFVGGAGADTMTGGGGVNEYLYGAISDSTSSAMDVITNFKAATDLIDLSGISSTPNKLNYVGQLGHKSSSIGADSVVWQTSGPNTYVYVNTTGGTESLSSAQMVIQLDGKVSLSTGNFYL